MKANTIEVVERQISWLRSHTHDCSGYSDCVRCGAADTIERLRAHIAVLIENDTDEPISDAGHTVIDLWRHEARAMIAAAKGDAQ